MSIWVTVLLSTIARLLNRSSMRLERGIQKMALNYVNLAVFTIAHLAGLVVAITLLLKIKDFKKLYQNLHKQEIKLGRKYKVRLGKKPSPEKLSKAKLNEKLLAIDIYMKTSNMVDRMYRQIIQQQ